jgi:hypothetical protein
VIARDGSAADFLAQLVPTNTPLLCACWFTVPASPDAELAIRYLSHQSSLTAAFLTIVPVKLALRTDRLTKSIHIPPPCLLSRCELKISLCSCGEMDEHASSSAETMVLQNRIEDVFLSSAMHSYVSSPAMDNKELTSDDSHACPKFLVRRIPLASLCDALRVCQSSKQEKDIDSEDLDAHEGRVKTRLASQGNVIYLTC